MVSDPRGRAALQRCREKGFWFSGFCAGQGQPPPGAYWNYSAQVANWGRSPVADVPWTLGNTYFDVASTAISLADRDAAISNVISILRTGLPVNMSFPAFSNAIGDGSGGTIGLLNDMSWFVSPELAGCDAATLVSAFQPNGGHVVNIIGYSIVYGASGPDLFQSYFIIENNWGKGFGHRGNYTMSFAGFKLLAGGLSTMKLRCSFPSNVCQP